MKIITMHMVRDTLGFKGPMDVIDLASEPNCCILKVWEVAEKAKEAGLIQDIGGLLSTKWRG